MMKCPYCNKELKVVDEWYETAPDKKQLLILHMAGICNTCNKNFDWEYEYNYNTNSNNNLREVSNMGEVLKQFEEKA